MKHLTTLLILMISISSSGQFVKDTLQLKSASNHPMQYYVSLPAHWSKEKKWPVIVIIEAAEKEYRKNAMRFVNARKDLPFILIAPYNVNNSRYGRRDPKIFPYSSETWDYIDKVGDCQFNEEGILQIITDVQQEFNGDSKVYITGFEAGAHTVWQFVFQHPEKLNAAAPVAGNYNQNSCMSSSRFSTHTSKTNLPIRSFVGSADAYFGPGGKVYNQWQAALRDATDHGYKNLEEKVIEGKEHVPLPEEVVSWFYKIYKQ